MEWSEEVSHGARRVHHERKRKTRRRLPLTEGTAKLVVFLKATIAFMKERLLGSDIEVARIWMELCEHALSYLIIVSRR